MNPLTLHKRITDKLPNFYITVYQTEELTGYKLHFKDGTNKEKILISFKEFGPQAKVISCNEKRLDTTVSPTSFSCVVENISTITKVEDWLSKVI